MNKLFLILIMLNFVFNLTAVQVTGKGVGNSEDAAKKSALSDLSSFIEVHIQSEINDIVKETAVNDKRESEEIYSQIIQTKSSLPVLGASFKTTKKANLFYTDATLSSDKSLKLYELELKKIANEVNFSNKKLSENISASEKYIILKNLMGMVNNYYKYKLVATFLESNSIPQVTISETEIKNQLLFLSSEIDDLVAAGRFISDGINVKNIYIEPASFENYNEVTDFAVSLKNSIQNNLKDTTENKLNSDYIFSGSYRIVGNTMEISYKLLDMDKKVIDSKLIKVAETVYKNYTYRPKNEAFENELLKGKITNKDFKIEVTTDKGSGNLLFNSEDTVKLYLKSNKPGYIFIAGHIFLDNEDKYSYLLEFNPDLKGNDKFLYYISVEQINTWIEMGEFSIEPPFGYETVQVVGMGSKDLATGIPHTVYDDNYGYYIISKDPNSGLMQTRGLKKTKSSINDENNVTESVLSFKTQNN